MPTTTSPPILIWQPGGGTPIWTPAPPPAGHAAPENGLTALIVGQDYVDVVFVTTQPRADWTFAGLEVVNVTDTAPLNIWVGTATSKTRNGFRVYLNGLPDTGNYYLDWSINGGTVANAGTATTYLLSGPDNGPNGAGTTFTVALPPGTTLEEPMTVTPDDGGVPGTFSPATVELTSDMPSANFAYTPGSYGARVITVTNDQFLTDPGGIVFTSVVATYLLSGPTTGTPGMTSTNFTVSLPVGGVTLSTITVTPNDAGLSIGIGPFIPTSVTLTTAAPSATFTYTPVAAGSVTIAVTNNRGLTDPVGLTYVVTTIPESIAGLKLWLRADSLALADAAIVSTWPDSSVNGNNATGTATYKTNIVNGKPVLRFNGGTDYMTANMLGSLISTASVFMVLKTVTPSSAALISTPSNPANSFSFYLPAGTDAYFDLGDSTGTGRVHGPWGGNNTDFFVWSAVAGAGNMAIYRNGTVVISSGGHTNSFTPAGLVLNISGIGSTGLAGDTAEILIYNTALSTTDRQTIELFLKTKYGL